VTPAVEFWFEFASTYSYPAAMRVEAMARDRGRSIEWRPFLLGPIFKSQGWNDSPFNLYEAKGRYMWRDLERICDRLGIPFKRPSQFPRGSLLAARVACAANGEPWMPQFVRNVYTANFADDRDISKAEVVQECLQGLVADPGRLLKLASEDNGKALLRQSTERAAALGIFGAPTFVAGKELFWGNDRMEAALEWKA
jgi:2-hydroxychromene-2-carboxylate isomerase